MSWARLSVWLFFLSPVMAVGACKSERPCDALARRNAECADAFVQVAKDRARASMAGRIERLAPASRDQARAEMEARFAKAAKSVRETLTSDEFLIDCRQNWNDPAKMPPALKKELERCRELPDCRDYAACFVESAKLSP